MRLFEMTDDVVAITEGDWKFRLHLKDIFKNFQAAKINLGQAKSQIKKRLERFISSTENLTDNIKKSIDKIISRVADEANAEKIDDIINDLYTIADASAILVK